MLQRKLGTLITLVVMAAATSATATAAGRPASQTAKYSNATVAALLEKAGYDYSKIGDGIWEIQFKGKNVAQFPVRVVLSQDIILVMAKLADRKDVALSAPLFQKLLELNDSMDTVKFALSQDMLYMRLELHARLVDEEELKYLLGQVSGAVDEAYPQIKQFLPKEK
ncbi:MAG TPA: YbjN domain-containing protein [Blastocatellia bacterium]|nr:YbjN domain-containing protein [Blastocatellia bacterium]